MFRFRHFFFACRCLPLLLAIQICLQHKHDEERAWKLGETLKKINNCIVYLCKFHNSRALIYSTITQKLRLEMTMHESDSSKTTAELVFWYWSHKKIVILQLKIIIFVA
jgi:hypothetical protein